MPLHRSRLSPTFAASVAALLLACFAPATAAAIYKCTDAAGHSAYSDQPCADAQELKPPPLPLVPALKPAPPNSRQAEQHTVPTRERQQPRAEAAQKKACAKLALRRRWAEQDLQQARSLPLRPNDKRLENAQRKARRADEQYRLECGGHDPDTDLPR
ncbi:DUF4124 domain-containing protein [Herbaspirillum sp.]|uniref:DUF4124 domain-containing protein n=1 Tax=Herbaspirillum sp. TaxID=1890675 RepID=UPI001B2597E7|nr:DUF4124 domain-containing protein [Herbaspirillum sp.]MBO9537539.1 DUF4124 domain-containing protein [Herbaspirillum sp.]